VGVLLAPVDSETSIPAASAKQSTGGAELRRGSSKSSLSKVTQLKSSLGDKKRSRQQLLAELERLENELLREKAQVELHLTERAQGSAAPAKKRKVMLRSNGEPEALTGLMKRKEQSITNSQKVFRKVPQTRAHLRFRLACIVDGIKKR